jgi:heme-degrading monooxygenase HmoA
MVELAAQQPGFLGIESVRQADGTGITVSYWQSEEAVRAWKQHAEHILAQRQGRSEWYRRYRVRVCRVQRQYG